MREVRYTIALDWDVRLRHAHRTERGKVRGFVVQLEARKGGRWRSVVRYGSAHGLAHRHLYRWRGKRRRETLGLGFADADLRQNWERYIRHYGAER